MHLTTTTTNGSIPMYKTHHAVHRQQQRGIATQTLELLQQYGRRVYDHHGACKLIFDKRAQNQVKAALGKAAAQIRFGVYAVIDASASATVVITTGHLTRRCKTA